MVRASLADLKHVKNELGGTVNDVILAAVAGALGRHLRARGHATQGLEMIAHGPDQRPHRRISAALSATGSRA